MPLERLSLVTVPVELKSKTGEFAGRATGFFYKESDDRVYFVTNWHVLTGRNPRAPTIVPHNRPHEAILRLHKRVSSEDRISLTQKLEMVVPLYRPEDETTPAWLEHPKLRHAPQAYTVATECFHYSRGDALHRSLQFISRVF